MNIVGYLIDNITIEKDILMVREYSYDCINEAIENKEISHLLYEFIDYLKEINESMDSSYGFINREYRKGEYGTVADFMYVPFELFLNKRVYNEMSFIDYYNKVIINSTHRDLLVGRSLGNDIIADWYDKIPSWSVLVDYEGKERSFVDGILIINNVAHYGEFDDEANIIVIDDGFRVKYIP